MAWHGVRFFFLRSFVRSFSVFKWDKGGASIEGVDEATAGLLDEHKLSIPDLGGRYCTSLNPDRPEQSPGMDGERALQVNEGRSYVFFFSRATATATAAAVPALS